MFHVTDWHLADEWMRLDYELLNTFYSTPF